MSESWIDEQLVARGIRDPRVLDAMARVPREAFVPEASQAQAYADRALPMPGAARTSAVEAATASASAPRSCLTVRAGIVSGRRAAWRGHPG